MEGLKDDGEFEEEEDNGEDRRRLMEVQKSEQEIKNQKYVKLAPHHQDRKLWVKIKRMAKQPTRGLAYASSSNHSDEDELSLHEMIDKAHDRHRILSL